MSENIKNILLRINALVEEIQEQLELAFDNSSDISSSSLKSPEDNAKLQISLAYTMNSLYLIWMKLQNIPITDHPIISDMVNFLLLISNFNRKE